MSVLWLLISLISQENIPGIVFVGLLLLVLGQIMLRRPDTTPPPSEPLSPSQRESQRRHKSWIDSGK